MKCQCVNIDKHKMMIIPNSKNDLVVLLQENDNTFLIEGLNTEVNVPVNYCPICGRNLKEERWWE